MSTVTKQLNFNVGILGHVDSGKTSLCKALSTVASTACFDKHPQSRERGITLDLGFSSFSVDLDDESKERLGGCDTVQYTLVDCPGHASLIRTIIGGAQIIDLMVLVVDIVKGMQTQTAECLIIGEILCRKMVVVLNKVDLIKEEKRAATIEKMKKRMLKTLENTQFRDSRVVAVAAGGGAQETSIGMDELMKLLTEETYVPSRSVDGPFTFAVDHCFQVKGQGTVLTGTVLGGKALINDNVEIPSVKMSKKIKSMQMFKKPVDSIKQGDRAGICVTQFDAKQLERGFVCAPGSLPTIFAAIVSVRKISHFKSPLLNKSKFHITVAHETVMGSASFFSISAENHDATAAKFDFTPEYDFLDEVAEEDGKPRIFFALLELEKPVICPNSAKYIGSKLDTDVDANICRLAFHGELLESFTDKNYMANIMTKVKVFKRKSRQGMVERCLDQNNVIVKNLFKKETDVSHFTNLRVELSTGEKGIIEGGFGQSGKTKIRIPDGLSEATWQKYGGMGKKKKKDQAEATESLEPILVTLAFKKYIYSKDKAMKQ